MPPMKTIDSSDSDMPAVNLTVHFPGTAAERLGAGDARELGEVAAALGVDPEMAVRIAVNRLHQRMFPLSDSARGLESLWEPDHE